MMFLRGKKFKWAIILTAVLIIGIVLIGSLTGGVSAEVYDISKGEIKQYVEDTAQVLSKEKQTVYIEGSGKVVDISVDVGNTVKKGDLLLSLDKTELELQLKDAKAKIEASEAQLKGTDVISYANKIELAKAAVDQAQVEYDSAERNFENARKLYESQAISNTEFETAQDRYKTAQVALNTANVQLEDIRNGAPEYVKSGYKSQLEQSVILRDTILRSIQKQEVRADIDGVVLEKLVENNSMVSPSTTAFVIGNPGSLELEADILQDDISKVKIGNEVEISGKALGNEIIKGEVVKIAPAAKEVTSSLGVSQKRVTVTIKITDETNMLKPGYSLDAKIITAVRSGIIKVPDSAVFDYQDKSMVFVVQNGKAILKTVKKGIESGNFIEIEDGLKEGDTILVKPDNNIKEGAKIKPLVKKQ